MDYVTLSDYHVTFWSGKLEDDSLLLRSCSDNQLLPALNFHG